MELSQLYFEQLGAEREEESSNKVLKESYEEEVYQCSDCLTVYNEVYGDVTQDIKPNTPFEALSETYECSLCEAPKSSFEKKVLIKTS